MKTLDASILLREEIRRLEIKQSQEAILLKEQFNITYNNLKPVNLVKSLFDEVSSSPDILDNIINTGIGMATGFITKKFLLGSSKNPLSKLLGTALEFGVANIVTKNSEIIKTQGEKLMKLFTKKKKPIKESEY
ncbi:MAG TPA: hypothetical protein VK590_06765 [Saprospiraceae bacterium]|nr:hypothetical protein [Saprospiraceae bacterium]